MTSRERINCILSLEVPDRMGLYDHFWKETIPDYWIHEGYPEGTSPEDHFGYDIERVQASWFKVAPLYHQDETVDETNEWRVSRNGFGATLKHWKHKSGTPQHIAFDCASREIWEKNYKPHVMEFDPDRVDIEQVRSNYNRLMAGDRFVVFNHLMHLEIMRVLLGDVVMLQSLLLAPGWIHDICNTYTRLFTCTYEYIFREVGLPDGMFAYEDLGFSNGPYMSEKTYRELLMPHHRELFNFFRDHGLPIIWHSCGDVRKLVPAMIETGMNCLQPMEAKAGCNVLELSRLYGDRISFMGNVDVTKLNTNDPDIVRAEVESKLNVLRERRVPYVFHSDHSIPPDVRYDTYRAALELYRQNAAY